MPRIEVKYNGRTGAAVGSRTAGLVADNRFHLGRLINLDGEAGVVNCVVRRDYVQSHNVGHNRPTCGRGAAENQAKGSGDRENGGES
jgi:hypothetical protein